MSSILNYINNALTKFFSNPGRTHKIEHNLNSMPIDEEAFRVAKFNPLNNPALITQDSFKSPEYETHLKNCNPVNVINNQVQPPTLMAKALDQLSQALILTPALSSLSKDISDTLGIVNAISRFGNLYYNGQISLKDGKSVARTAVEVAYLANALIDNPIGKGLKLGDKLLQDAQNIVNDIKTGADKDKLIKHSLALIATVLRIVILCRGGTELKIALTLVQIVTSLHLAVLAASKDKTLEQAMHLMNTAVFVQSLIFNVSRLIVEMALRQAASSSTKS